MKPETRARKIAELFGIDVPKPPSPQEIARRNNRSREAEAVILFHENPEKFLQRECRVCRKTFAVNRANISMCSDDCRSVHINDVIGLEWSPTGRSPEERWKPQTGGQEPLIVPPAALALLQPVQTDDAVAG